MSKHHHIGLLTTGQGFLKSANKLNDGQQWLAAPLSVYYLYFHSIELALKSFIYLKSENEKELRAIRHNLEQAWSRAEEVGIEELFPENQELKECISMVNPTYEGKELEYFYPGLKKLPDIEHVSNACNKLIQVLDRHYRSKLKETRNK
jgi:hypothetical protein